MLRILDTLCHFFSFNNPIRLVLILRVRKAPFLTLQLMKAQKFPQDYIIHAWKVVGSTSPDFLNKTNTWLMFWIHVGTCGSKHILKSSYSHIQWSNIWRTAKKSEIRLNVHAPEKGTRISMKKFQTVRLCFNIRNNPLIITSVWKMGR